MAATHPTEPPILLIVDDDPDVLRALAFMAAARGFGAHRCRTGRQAIAVAAAGRRVTALIIDQNLPDLQGIELLAKLRDMGMSAPAVLMTTSPSSALCREAAAAGAPIVEKPLLDEDLFTQIHRLLRTD